MIGDPRIRAGASEPYATKADLVANLNRVASDPRGHRLCEVIARLTMSDASLWPDSRPVSLTRAPTYDELNRENAALLDERRRSSWLEHN